MQKQNDIMLKRTSCSLWCQSPLTNTQKSHDLSYIHFPGTAVSRFCDTICFCNGYYSAQRIQPNTFKISLLKENTLKQNNHQLNKQHIYKTLMIIFFNIGQLHFNKLIWDISKFLNYSKISKNITVISAKNGKGFRIHIFFYKLYSKWKKYSNRLNLFVECNFPCKYKCK